MHRGQAERVKASGGIINASGLMSAAHPIDVCYSFSYRQETSTHVITINS